MQIISDSKDNIRWIFSYIAEWPKHTWCLLFLVNYYSLLLNKSLELNTSGAAVLRRVYCKNDPLRWGCKRYFRSEFSGTEETETSNNWRFESWTICMLQIYTDTHKIRFLQKENYEPVSDWSSVIYLASGYNHISVCLCLSFQSNKCYFWWITLEPFKMHVSCFKLNLKAHLKPLPAWQSGSILLGSVPVCSADTNTLA